MKCSKCGKAGITKYCPDCGGKMMIPGKVICLELERSFKKWNKGFDDSEYMEGSRHCPSIIRKNCFDTACRLQGIIHNDIGIRGEWMTQKDADVIMEMTKELYQQALNQLKERREAV